MGLEEEMPSGVKGSEWGQRLFLPDLPGLREALQRKLEEYKKRKPPPSYISPEALIQDGLALKVLILQELLEKGEVYTNDFARDLNEKAGAPVNERAFNTACSVIADYLETGGANLRGGTGL